MEEKDYTLNPFNGEEILIGGTSYRRVKSHILNWLNEQCAAGPDPDRERTFCGKSEQIPDGYNRRGTPYECMRKGIKLGICTVYNKMNPPRRNRTRACPVCGARIMDS